MTINPDYGVLISPQLNAVGDRAWESRIRPYDGARIELPQRFQPERISV